jgi:hypothetical protein
MGQLAKLITCIMRGQENGLLSDISLQLLTSGHRGEILMMDG